MTFEELVKNASEALFPVKTMVPVAVKLLGLELETFLKLKLPEIVSCPLMFFIVPPVMVIPPLLESVLDPPIR